jgi:hypothetical protein
MDKFKTVYYLEAYKEFNNDIRCTAHIFNLAAKAIISEFNKNTINSNELQEIELSAIFTYNGEEWENLSKKEKDNILKKLLGIYLIHKIYYTLLYKLTNLIII